MYQNQVMAWLENHYCDVERPLFTWTAKKVFEIHKKYGIEPNPLYKKGAGRVGCFPCVQINHRELKNLSIMTPEIWDAIFEIEAITGRSFFPPKYIPKKFCKNKEYPMGWEVEKYISKHPDQIQLQKKILTPSCMSQYALCE